LELQVAVEESILGTWSTDPTRLRQVLFNLAGNAVKYTMHGSVEIRALACADQAGHEMLEIRVSDSGPGIAEDERELIFEQFRRGRDEVSRGQEGLGLGLALCRDIAALLGGSLSVESTVSVGSVFTFKMPIERAQVSRSRRAPLSGRTALVVGLSEGVRRRVASHLEGMGFDVETAGDGFMALGAAERTAYQHGTLDLLVLDAALVGLPADVLLVRLQANRSFERTRTVLVSNGPLAGSVEGRADLVVSHPVEASDLDRAVGSLFESTSALQEVYPRAPASPRLRILVVEDNRINQALFLDVLNRSNFSAFAASSGEEAVQAAERGGFDLILMDVQMPGIDGTEATRRIRAMDTQRRIPIVGLTAHSGAVMRKRCLDAGMDLVLHKPVDLSRLPLRIREVINSALPAENEQVEAGDLEHGHTLDIADEYVEVLVAELGVERARSCMTGFLSDTAIHIPTLRGQVQAEDWHAVANLAHSLAGAAGTLGAATLTDALLMLEQFARLEDKTRLLAALGEVDTVWNRTRSGLRRRFDFIVARRSGAVSKAA
jgi:CheY-like chemotaxis protein/anti-sigma regulatory factor (Ser/Thr protein kinase)